MKIFTGTNNKKLSDKIASSLEKTFDIEFRKFESLKIERFSDGEIMPTFKESIRNQDVYFIQSLSSNEMIMETLLVADAAKRAGCSSFCLVTPYMGYSRQDKTDHIRSSIGSKMLADILEKVGVTSIITFDLHSSSIQGFYNIPVINLNGNKIFIDYLKSQNIEDLCVVAPDQGAVKRASDYCKIFTDATFSLINKKRIKPNEVHSMELVGDVTGKNVILVDDIADTLGTLKKASELIMLNGAKSVRAIATHGVLSGKSLENLESSPITELLVSDTVEKTIDLQTQSSKIKVISCFNFITDIIHTINQNKSIHEVNYV